ncbi:MAG: hypothetical protein ACRD4I_14045, partial [Candidatus Angelobacter sp.]
MKVVWHHDKFVQMETSQLAIFIEHIKEQPAERFFPEQGIAEVRDRGDEKRAVLLRSFSQCPPALKRCYSKASFRGPKGPFFHP